MNWIQRKFLWKESPNKHFYVTGFFFCYQELGCFDAYFDKIWYNLLYPVMQVLLQPISWCSLTWWLRMFCVEAVRLHINVVGMYILQSSQDEKYKSTITRGGNRNKTFRKYWIMCHIEVVMVPQKSECNLRSLGREWGNLLTYQWYLQTEAPSWCSGFLVSSEVEHWWKKILWRTFIYSLNNCARWFVVFLFRGNVLEDSLDAVYISRILSALWALN